MCLGLHSLHHALQAQLGGDAGSLLEADATVPERELRAAGGPQNTLRLLPHLQVRSSRCLMVFRSECRKEMKPSRGILCYQHNGM